MTTLSDINVIASTHFEVIAASFWDAAYPVRYELICILVFGGGWILGTLARSRRRARFINDKSKFINDKGLPRRTRVHQRQNRTAREANIGLDAVGGIANVDQSFLKHGAWVARQVLKLHHSPQTRNPESPQGMQALQLYRTAMQAGLKLEDIRTDECQQLFMALVTATIRAGQLAETKELLSDLRQSGLGVDASLFTSITKLCAAKHLYRECLALYDFVRGDPSFSLAEISSCSCLLFCATEAQDHEKSEDLWQCVNACGTPSQKDFCNMLRITGQRPRGDHQQNNQRGDWERALSLIQEMHASQVEVNAEAYNNALATCVGAGRLDQALLLLVTVEKSPGIADAITYNTVMKGYATMGKIDQCFEVFDRMCAKGLSPSQVTYGIIIDCCINENQVSRAMQVVEKMTASGCSMNVVLYTTLIKGFVRADALKDAMAMYKHMMGKGNVNPDVITYSVLIKANCDKEHIEDALLLLSEMVALRLKPDEMIFNNLIAGCRGHPSLGEHLYADMVKAGVQPSNATFSILIRHYHQCKMLATAVVMLKTEPAKHNVEPEPRLFLQLLTSCVRDRQGKRAIEVYMMMSERSLVSSSVHSSIIRTCIRVNMSDIAVEMVSMAIKNGAGIKPTDLSPLLAACANKGRAHHVTQSCMASMRALGIPVDAKYESLEASNREVQRTALQWLDEAQEMDYQ